MTARASGALAKSAVLALALVARGSGGGVENTGAHTLAPGGAASWTLEPPALGSLAVVNHHCLAIDELRVRPASSPAWSANLLRSPLGPSSTYPLDGLAVGTYDAHAVSTVDGGSWTMSGLTIHVGATASWSLHIPAGTGCLTFVNNAEPGVTIRRLFAPPSPQGCTGVAWGTELLAGRTIPPDASFTVSNLAQGPHDLWALTDAEPYRFCGVSVPSGANTFWYLTPP